ncbi:hypothetical protein CEXT_596381 [Caerostris extrusa]|uniref:Uncharacterized protein n=1 Tax=Caerostris extrusa TaxID=172846 RepID=A0AAV4TK93_CAEEX|nr:hypothetical protein CEXT_596381 [Caerostris extrusa]
MRFNCDKNNTLKRLGHKFKTAAGKAFTQTKNHHRSKTILTAHQIANSSPEGTSWEGRGRPPSKLSDILTPQSPGGVSSQRQTSHQFNGLLKSSGLQITF